MSLPPPALPADFLPVIRKRLAGFGFGSSQFDSKHLDGSGGENGEHRSFYRQKLPVSGEILPEVEKSLVDACQRLGLPRGAVHAFVRPSSEMNATCYSGIRGAAVIEINAGVIECLSTEELSYVIGHELGHYILPVRWAKVLRDGAFMPASLEDARISRECELTMDRFGLLACGDLKHAGSAILKMQSGLSSRHIRSDLAAFIQNGRLAFEVEADDGETLSSHPPEFLRLRAINAFTMSDVFRQAAGKEGGQPIAEINAGVQRDLDRAVDALAQRLMDKALNRLAQSLAAYCVASRIKVESARFNQEGVVLDLDRVRSLASNWSQHQEDARSEAFAKKLSDLIPACVRSCPRRTEAYLEGLRSEFAGTPIAEVCANIKVGLDEASRIHFST